MGWGPSEQQEEAFHEQDESDEHLAVIRREAAENKKVMRDWFHTDRVLEAAVADCKQCLSPQIRLMHRLLSWHNPSSELNNVGLRCRMRLGGIWGWRW